MKKMYILALVAATMAFSCNKNAVEQAPVQEPVLRTFTCTIAEPDTKLAIDDATGKTIWEVGDEILIHGKATSENVTVTLTSTDISADAKTATFSVALPATAYDPDGYYAAYPADAYIEYSSGRGYYYNTFDETNLPLMSAYLSGDSFLFFNLCGAISFVVDGDYDQYVFSGNNDETVGYDRYNVKILSSEKNYCRVSGTEGTAGAKTSITASVVSDGTTVNRVFFPNGASFTDGFTIKFLKGGSIVKTLSTTSSVSVPRNSYRPMGDVTAYLKDYVAPTTHNSSIDMAGATALDGSGNANCYVVDGSVAANAEKVFTFKAYKGNSAVGVGTIASTAILWETYNNAETVTANSVIAAVDFEKKSENDFYTMVFKMPATLHAGNALIAAKDAGGNILWSWHIWVPSVAISATDKTAVIGGSVMNMNLGALEEVPGSGSATIASLGLLYQWGRKDPFVGAAEWKDYPAKAKVAGSAWTLTKSRVTMAEAILHPMVLYIDPAQNDNKGWMETPDATLWNNSGSKTIYDPCPAGYKVPVKTGSIWTKTDTDWTFDATNHVCELSGVRIPLAGYVECWGGSLYGNGTGSEHAYLWSATSHDGDDERGDCVYIRAFRTSGKYYGNSRGKANAASVRCVAE